MKTSQNGLSIIKKYEGCKLTAYKCPAGVWTIGYGHTGKDVKEGLKITRAKAEEFLKQDLAKFENYVNNTKLNLNQNQFDALVSFTYNCGNGNLIKLIKDRTLPQIADALLLYNKANGKTLVGLTRRRTEEKELFLTPIETIQETTSQEVPKQENKNGLPYEVITTCNLNIRKGPNTLSPKIRVALKGTKLIVWAIETIDGIEWGKNGNEYFCLKYCKKIKG